MVLFAVPGRALGFFGIDFVKPFTISILLAAPWEFSPAMSTEFTPIFLFLLVAVGIALSMLIASAVLGPHKHHQGQADALRVGHEPVWRCQAAV